MPKRPSGVNRKSCELLAEWYLVRLCLCLTDSSQFR